MSLVAAGVIQGQPTPPTVSTLAANAVGAANATLNGTANPRGAPTWGWFEWGTTTNYGNITAAQALGSGSSQTNFSRVIGGLSSGVSYHFRAMASNSVVGAAGADLLFTNGPFLVANVVFSDDFESGTMSNWTTTVDSPLYPVTYENVVPPSPAGMWSAEMGRSTDRMHHNLIADNGGVELIGHTIFTAWIGDFNVSQARIFNEVRGYAGGSGLPNGGTNASGQLAQLLAIGKYNAVTLPGEVWKSTNYQGRVTFGTNTGWFNLDAAGAPNRSAGWHRFDIERRPDGTTLNFFVDGILSRTITGTTNEPWDTVMLGSGIGVTFDGAYIDGIAVSVVQPRLFIERQGSAVRISWPRPSPGFVLDQSTSVTGDWSQVSFPYTTNVDLSITVPAPTGARFYRLRRP